MTCLIQFLVVSVSARFFPVSLGRNDDLFPGRSQEFNPPFVSIITFIRPNSPAVERGQKLIGAVQIAGLPGRQNKPRGIPQCIGCGRDLGAQSALAAANGLVVTVFFGAPALC